MRLDAAPDAKARSPSSAFGLASRLDSGGVRRRRPVNCTVVSSRTEASPSDQSSSAWAVSTQPNAHAKSAAATSIREATVSVRRCALLGILVPWFVSPGHAAVAPADAARLGTTLTPMGAKRAGNADGSIPAWTGGMAVAAQGAGPRPAPFAAERPLLSITANDFSCYADPGVAPECRPSSTRS